MVGVIGFGGFGYMGVKFVYVLGLYVVMIIILFQKGKDVKVLGVDEVFLFMDDDVMVEKVGQFDFFLNMILVGYNFDLYMNLLWYDGIMCIVGVVMEMDGFQLGLFMVGCKLIVGFFIGGI